MPTHSLDLAPWRSPLARALHRNRALAHARYLQLATVALSGRPANRTVVFRGFVPGDDRLQLICDRRSQKVEEIHCNPWTEACWYFPKTREQFRLSGSLRLITGEAPTQTAPAQTTVVETAAPDVNRPDANRPDANRPDAHLPKLDPSDTEIALRQHLWQTLSSKAQAQFYWPTPGQPQMDSAEVTPQTASTMGNALANSLTDCPEGLPATFCLLLLIPDRIDHLDLRENPQIRYQYILQEPGSWSRHSLNP